MLEGGVGTIGTVLGSLKSGVPVVVIKDSGRAADLLGNVQILTITFTEYLIRYCYSKQKIRVVQKFLQSIIIKSHTQETFYLTVIVSI